MLCFAQCKEDAAAEFKSKGGLRVLVRLDDASLKPDNGSAEIRNQVMQVLHNRVEYYGVTPHIEWLEAERQILVEIPGVEEPDRTLRLLENETNLEFWETYELRDIYAPLVSADECLAQLLRPDKNSNTDNDKQKTIALSDSDLKNKQPADALETLLEKVESSDQYSFSDQEYEADHPLFAKLMLNMYQSSGGYEVAPGPVVGYAKVDDMDQVTEYLSMTEVKSKLPRDLFLRWAVKSMDGEGAFYELFALKQTMRQGAVLDGSVITEAKVESDGQGGNAITLLMNEEGARQWARITKDNIGKSIAMVVDNQVYSAPRVNDQITGGRSMITGHFTKEEAGDLANMLNAGRMPAPIRIVHHEMVSPVTK